MQIFYLHYFNYSIKDINSYKELADEEKNIISEDAWDKIVLK